MLIAGPTKATRGILYPRFQKFCRFVVSRSVTTYCIACEFTITFYYSLQKEPKKRGDLPTLLVCILCWVTGSYRHCPLYYKLIDELTLLQYKCQIANMMDIATRLISIDLSNFPQRKLEESLTHTHTIKGWRGNVPNPLARTLILWEPMIIMQVYFLH